MNKPYIIADMGVNFFDTAKVMNISPMEAAKIYIDKAAEVGIDCAKFQSYKAKTIVSRNSPAYWDLNKEPTKTQYELFLKHDCFEEKDYLELSRYAHAKGMDFTSTPFDYDSADYLETMIDFYKVSSSDLSNLPFIHHIGKKGRPVYISVGASYLSEVDEALRALKEVGCKDIVVLHCVLCYPTKPENANLRIIETLKRDFPNVRIGYSDHVAPDDTMMTLSTAYLLGAEVIEKHFTLDKTLLGNDHYHAGDPDDFRKAIANFKWIDTVLGSEEKIVLDCEQISRREARRSLVLTKEMKAGEVIKRKDIMAKRPGTGISPEYLDVVIGRKVVKELAEDTILTWDMI
ncbi:N-acetylneuraminate synthase family protein [Acetatifactor muris]|uniref:N,N'-diacetyllegionaminic acid synthase n=1 Tax=Acetatifactor muris TaxID=879566 RepID=A0A2K4ZAP1_9FIRM|nr:N-acetylneuraminate synthase family protein [Acetatifactor muris]MCR2048728.1 N-acetylneuraminate synthase family protein [Acetatifactor muris]SOY27521.1 N,N'-diacetyllegionaminic acid synthase [Acetatifactor muris]